MSHVILGQKDRLASELHVSVYFTCVASYYNAIIDYDTLWLVINTVGKVQMDIWLHQWKKKKSYLTLLNSADPNIIHTHYTSAQGWHRNGMAHNAVRLWNKIKWDGCSSQWGPTLYYTGGHWSTDGTNWGPQFVLTGAWDFCPGLCVGMGGGAWRKAGPLFVRVSAGRNKGSGSSRTQSSRQMTFKTYKQELQIHQKRGSSGSVSVPVVSCLV